MAQLTHLRAKPQNNTYSLNVNRYDRQPPCQRGRQTTFGLTTPVVVNQHHEFYDVSTHL